MELKLLSELYRGLVRLRLVEESIAERYAEQEMRCPVHLSIGQEAVPVGVCAHLSAHDYAMSTHRSHNHYLAKGGDLKRMVAEIYGKATGCSSGKGGSMHLIDRSVGFLGATPIVGSTIPIGVGTALGSVMAGERRVVVVFLGEGATEEGVFHESVNFACLKKLPVVFVCENNLYSVYSNLAVRQPIGRKVFEVAAGHGIWSREGDGNDVEIVHQLAGEAIARARAGDGPAFIEFSTYRWREHCGPNFDNSIGYRTDTEFDHWKRNCTIMKSFAHLKSKGVFSDEQNIALRYEIQAEIDDAFEFAKRSPFPHPDQLKTQLFSL
jgi:pyruvate dehydrogenase E1 component alpha subunit